MSFGAVLGRHRDEFFTQYWQKKPLLIRQAFPGGLSAVDADELAGLACLEGVDTRLVLEHGARPWEVRQGPFEEKSFTKLPATHWTLLVQAVDRLVPAVSALKQQFRFLPNWRVDDIMISYATDQGSVGPHTDHYDVFLIQGQGRRRWEISAAPLETIELLDGVDLKILKNFKPDLTFDLEPGDMLYLPPSVAHHGRALGSCLTYSVGFRAPTRRDMTLSYAQFLLQAAEDEPDVFYHDQTLTLGREPGLITEDEIARLWALVQEGWNQPEAFRRWVGAFLTEPRSFQEPADIEFDRAGMRAFLQRAGGCRRTEGGRFSYYHPGGSTLYFYAEGECAVVGSNLSSLAAYLCREEHYTLQGLGPEAMAEAGLDLLTHLWNRGFLREEEGEDE